MHMYTHILKHTTWICIYAYRSEHEDVSAFALHCYLNEDHAALVSLKSVNIQSSSTIVLTRSAGECHVSGWRTFDMRILKKTIVNLSHKTDRFRNLLKLLSIRQLLNGSLGKKVDKICPEQ